MHGNACHCCALPCIVMNRPTVLKIFGITLHFKYVSPCGMVWYRASQLITNLDPPGSTVKRYGDTWQYVVIHVTQAQRHVSPRIAEHENPREFSLLLCNMWFLTPQRQVCDINVISNHGGYKSPVTEAVPMLTLQFYTCIKSCPNHDNRGKKQLNN